MSASRAIELTWMYRALGKKTSQARRPQCVQTPILYSLLVRFSASGGASGRSKAVWKTVWIRS
eukprot:UN2975